MLASVAAAVLAVLIAYRDCREQGLCVLQREVNNNLVYS